MRYFARWLGMVALIGWVGMPHNARADPPSLQWSAPTQNVDGSPVSVTAYTVYRSLDKCLSFRPISPPIPGTTTRMVDTLAPVGWVCYRVTASNAHGESDASNTLLVEVQPAPPTALPNSPTNLRIGQ
jgi:hypothetical protein